MKKLQRLLLLFVAILAFASCGSMEERIRNDEDTADVTVDFNNTDPIVIENDSADVDSVVVVNTPPAVYYIIAGSFKDFKNAEKLNQELAKAGNNPLILPKQAEFNRVVIAKFDNEAQARTELEKMRAQRNDKELWLLKGQ